MYKYYNVARMVEPKRKLLAEAQVTFPLLYARLASGFGAVCSVIGFPLCPLCHIRSTDWRSGRSSWTRRWRSWRVRHTHASVRHTHTSVGYTHASVGHTHASVRHTVLSFFWRQIELDETLAKLARAQGELKEVQERVALLEEKFNSAVAEKSALAHKVYRYLR